MYAAQSFSTLRKEQFKEIIKITMTFMLCVILEEKQWQTLTC